MSYYRWVADLANTLLLLYRNPPFKFREQSKRRSVRCQSITFYVLRNRVDDQALHGSASLLYRKV